MKIGFGLPLEYLAGNGGPYEIAFGRVEEWLALLRDQEIASVEVGAYGPDATAEDLLSAGETVIAAGLGVSLHSYLPQDIHGAGMRDAYPNHFPLLERLHRSQGETMIVLHGHSRKAPGDATALADSTMRVLERLTRIIRNQKPPVRVALENMRYHSDICDPCTTYRELLNIADGIGISDIGFCWDIGHTLSSVARHRLELDPPPEFLQRVIHSHVHDMAPGGDTHWPLTDNPLLARSIRRLADTGYPGVYTLELSPTRWPSGTAARAKALESIQRLRNILEERDD